MIGGRRKNVQMKMLIYSKMSELIKCEDLQIRIFNKCDIVQKRSFQDNIHYCLLQVSHPMVQSITPLVV